MNLGAQITRERVAKLCEETGQSQNDVARELGADPGHFSRILGGKRPAGRALAVKIFKRLGTPLEAWDQDSPTEAA